MTEPTPEERAELEVRFRHLAKTNMETSRTLMGRGAPIETLTVALERLDFTIDMLMGPMDADHPETAPAGRLVFEVGWQERIRSLLARRLAQSTGPDLLLPKGVQRPPHDPREN